MFFHQLPANGGISLPHACIEQSQILIYFGGSTHGGTRIAAVHFLLYGDSGWYTFDEITLRLAHAAQKLTGV